LAQSVAALSYMAVRIWYLPPAFRGSGPLTDLTLLWSSSVVVVDQGLSISSDRAKLFKIATSK